MSPAADLVRRPGVAVLIVLIVIGALLYHKPLSGRYIFAGPDSLAPSALGAGLRSLEQETGEIPLWQPWIFSGSPSLHAFIGISRLYLPSAVGRVLAAVGLPIFWMFLLHMLFAGFGCYLLVRRLGGSFAAGLLSGTGFMLMPYFNTMLVHGHGSQMMTLAYLPWLIWGVLRLHDRRSLASAALLALLCGLQLQRGHAQIAYYNLLMVGLVFLVLAVRSWRGGELSVAETGRFAGLFGLAMAAGLALAAQLYLPVMNYTPFSIRGGGAGGGTGFAYATQWSFSFGETVTWLLPSFYGFGGGTYWGGMPFTDYPNYMGLLLLALAAWAAAAGRSWMTWTLVAGGLLAYLLSLGDNFFLYKLFYSVFPYFDKFRVPSMLLVLTQFCVAVLAGLGLDAWLSWLDGRKEGQARRVLLMAGGGVVALALFFLVASGPVTAGLSASRGVPSQMLPQINALRGAMIRTDAMWMLAVGGLAVGSMLLWRQGNLPRKWLLAGLVGLSVVDLARIDLRIIEPAPDSLRSPVLQSRAFLTRYLNSDPVLEFLRRDTSSFRILPLGRLQNDNRWAIVGVESVGGYHAAKLANYDRIMQATAFQSEGILRMLNVKYLVSQQGFSDPRFEEVFLGNLYVDGGYKPAAVYRLRRFLERAWFPRRVEGRPAAEEIPALLRDTAYDPEEVVYLGVDEGADPDDLPPGGQGQVPSTTASGGAMAGSGQVLEASWQPDHIRLRVAAEGDALLVLSEVFYPQGWEAQVDGEAVPIHEVNGVLRGVAVTAGTHDVTLDFAPADIKLGRLISRISLVLVILGFAPAAYAKLRARP